VNDSEVVDYGFPKPADKALETLALIAKHELHVRPTYHGQRKPTGWMATAYDGHVIAAESKGRHDQRRRPGVRLQAEGA
jgi:hypothetical protein